LGTSFDKRRFRANIYLNLKSGKGFNEDLFMGRRLRVGAVTTIALMDHCAHSDGGTLAAQLGSCLVNTEHPKPIRFRLEFR
jgi:hypothetical protein